MAFSFGETSFNEVSRQLTLTYHGADGESFSEIITFPKGEALDPSLINSDGFKNAIKLIHLFCGVSYYKVYFGDDVDLPQYTLDPLEADLCNTMYSVGLSEFIFLNKLDFKKAPKFTASENVSSVPYDGPKPKGALVPLGGGKDSLVSLEALKSLGQTTAFFVGAAPIIDDLAKMAGVDLARINRKLSPRLFELNAEGRLNGHVPVTAINSAISVFFAMIEGFSQVVFSNESSANIGNNLPEDGFQINHQWSKSSEFENAFRDIVKKNVDNNVHYFSALREMNEMQIMKQFGKLPIYHADFSSCNRVFRLKDAAKEKWCCECEKCAFVFLATSATIGHSQAVEIFGKDLFEAPDLVPNYKALCGMKGTRKPFECVGEVDECRAAMASLIAKGKSSSVVFEALKGDFSAEDISAAAMDNILAQPDENVSSTVPANIVNAIWSLGANG